MFPPSTSPPAVKIIALSSSVDSLSVMVTVVATVATSAVQVTLPVNAAENAVAVNVPELGLYVRFQSDSNTRFPPSTSPPAVKITALFSFVDSLSVIVTVVAIAAVPVVS